MMSPERPSPRVLLWEKVKRIAAWMCSGRRRELAEDVANEVTLHLLEEEARTGVLEQRTIAIMHDITDELRKLQRRLRYEEPLQEQAELVDRADTAWRSSLAHLATELLEAAQLSPLEGRVVYRHYYLDIGLSVVAERLGVPLERIQLAHAEALRRLRAAAERFSREVER